MQKKPEIIIQQDPAGNRFLAIKCPDCGHVNRYLFEGLSGDIRLECTCGVGFNFTQKNYDDLMEKFGPDGDDQEKPN